MARVARLIDPQKINRLKKKLQDSEYVSFAVHVIAHKLTNQFFEERKTKHT